MSPGEKAWRAARELPPGHVGIREAQEALKKEYAKASEQERQFSKRWRGPKYLNSLQEAADFSANLCRSIGTRRVIREVRSPLEANHQWAAAYYSPAGLSIYVPGTPILTITLIHETAHHIVFVEAIPGTTHGAGFLEVEQLLFDYLLLGS